MVEVKQVKVRFAPSPTGYLHVGGARTAIFNWLFAKNTGGKFLLRIEDTDPQRSRSELSEQILRSLTWLGLDWDGEVIYQSDRIKRHTEIVEQLIKAGKAYYCFETPEELEQQRLTAQRKNEYFTYNRAALSLSKEQIDRLLKQNTPYYVRFFVPEGETEFTDLVHGKTVFRNSEIDDFIILRSEGSPVYQIAVVADDHDMGITHIIRGDDHLSNTPKQILLYKALGWDIPLFAHLPMITDQTGKKLSKRRDPVSIEHYRESGYLSEALFNFLTLLGFSPPAGKEIIKREELIRMFSFEKINKKSSVFDLKKLDWINSEYIRNYDEKITAKLLNEFLQKNYSAYSLPESTLKLPLDYLINVVKLMKERVFKISDFLERGLYYFKDPDKYDSYGVAKYWNMETKIHFTEYFNIVIKTNMFKADILETNLREFAKEQNIKPAVLIHPLRLALTGITISPGIFEVMEILGKTTVLRRIDKFLSEL